MFDLTRNNENPVIKTKFIDPTMKIPLIGRKSSPVKEINIGIYKHKFEPFPICKIKGRDYWLKGRSEILIFWKQDGINKVFYTTKKGEVCCMHGHAGMKYAVPGGGWEENEEHYETAIREALEEARRKVKNVHYAGYYIELLNLKKGEKSKDWKYVEKCYRWVGYYTEIFVGEYDGYYHGHIDKQDKDSMIRKGKFEPIEECYKKLRKEHRDAVDMYRRYRDSI